MADDNNGGNSNSGGANANTNAEVQIQIPGPSKTEAPATQEGPSGSSKAKSWKRWSVVAADAIFLIVGQTSATLLGRYYYSQGGNSKWLSTFVQTAGFPILFFGLFFFPSKSSSSETPVGKISMIYIILGLIITADNMMYSHGLMFLPVSTFSLICASQLAFNVFFSYVLTSQKLTGLIMNSVVLLTLAALLLGVNHETHGPTHGAVSGGKYLEGFLLTLGASGTYALILSLMQLTFENVIKKQTFSAVLNMQIYTALVATFASLVGLFASGEWMDLKKEMDSFQSGQFSYLMTLVWTSVSWQVASIGVVGVVFEVSSLFSNVISTFALPIVPLFGVMAFHDKMNGVKIIAMLISIWGFLSYLFQNYLDDKKARSAKGDS